MKYISVDQYIQYLKEYHLHWEKYYRKRNQPYESKCKNIDIFEKWCKKYNITEYCQGGYSWIKLDSMKRHRHQIKETPLQDHAEMFRTVDKKMIFITQPYVSMEKIGNCNLDEWCRVRGLKAVVSSELSWHYPDETILIQYTISNKSVFDNYIKQFKVTG